MNRIENNNWLRKFKSSNSNWPSKKILFKADKNGKVNSTIKRLKNLR